jgi:hypothetical protein
VEVEKLVAEYAAGGLTRDAFCQQRDLSVAALDKYRRRVQKWARSGAAHMLAVEVISSTVRDSNRDALPQPHQRMMHVDDLLQLRLE